MWWSDLLWGLWNGLIAWIALILHVFDLWEGHPFYNTQEAVTGTTSGFWSAQAPR